MLKLKNLFLKFLIILTVTHFSWRNEAYAKKQNFVIYTVKKNDTLYKILKKYKLNPIFGKKGSLKRTLDLNPKKKKSKGNLIYPREKIKIPYFKLRKGNKVIASEIIREDKEVEKKEPVLILSGMLEKNTVHLKWDIFPDNSEYKYEVKRALSDENEFKTIEDNITVKDFKDKDLILDKEYKYLVMVKDGNGLILNSNELKIIYKPIFYTSLKGMLKDKTIHVEWESIDENSSTKYILLRKSKIEDEFKSILLNSVDTNFSDMNIQGNRTYFYQVKAINDEKELGTSNIIEIPSFLLAYHESNIKLNVGTAYYTYHEYNTSNNTDNVLYTSLSPIIGLGYLKNWNEQFGTYSSLEFSYLDFLNSSYYNISGNPVLLFGLNLGLNYQLHKNVHIHEKLNFGKDVIYKPYSNNSNLQSIYVFNNMLYLGLHFYKTKLVDIFSEIGYISSLSFVNNNGLGSGYEINLSILKAFENFDFTTKLFYINKNIKTSDVNSNEANFGLIAEVTFPLGENQ
ncbi:LysM peptidoglycan-binding domain-containing protein [Pigmentibacter sp. JX0631]|uniref:LysM peptidoglycan-binding domain-containing protein n=1 Tax=Pigmentibacter sp. JX0631 TaxID=2976982 RepID=UPI00246983E9|nr:LysM peptidoglycan-binding domain-containing protein [Pigmentibacter sp. JX0631]WGL59902.1 LysM peptidoglycan-binding domain-containing protein [Pigmentibacter sp. JX0631]